MYSDVEENVLTFETVVTRVYWCTLWVGLDLGLPKRICSRETKRCHRSSGIICSPPKWVNIIDGPRHCRVQKLETRFNT